MTNETLTGTEYYDEGRDLGHQCINDAINRLAVAPSVRVLDVDLTAAPGSPSDGDSYIPAGTPTAGDAWEGLGGSLYLVTYRGTSWVARELLVGETFTILDEKKFVVVGTGAAPDFETIYTYT